MVELSALQEQIKQVARARQEAQRLTDEKMEKLKAWEDENQVFLDAVKVASEYRNEQENLLRELTLAVYAETGNKKPCQGVGIRELIKLAYDPLKALAWATEHKIALALDKRAFEGIAKQSPLDFVTSTTEIQATIATELKVEHAKTE